MTMSFALLLALALCWAIWTDLSRRTIPNWLTLAIALAAPGWWWATGLSFWPDVAIQFGLALGLLVLFAGLFTLGAMGGGDVKLIAALGLWFTPVPMLRLLVVMALLGGIVTLATLVRHRIRNLSETIEVPYGIAIALAALWVMANQLLTIHVR